MSHLLGWRLPEPGLPSLLLVLNLVIFIFPVMGNYTTNPHFDLKIKVPFIFQWRITVLFGISLAFYGCLLTTEEAWGHLNLSPTNDSVRVTHLGTAGAW